MNISTAAYDEALVWLAGQRPAMTELLGRLVNIDSGSYNHYQAAATRSGFQTQALLRSMVKLADA